VKKDKKSFFSYARKQSNSRSSTGPLEDSNGLTIGAEKEKAEELNKYFASVFTDMDTANVPAGDRVFRGRDDMKINDIDINEEIVRNKLSKLRANKASGPDDLKHRLLLEMENEICRPMAMLYRKSMDSGEIPDDWKGLICEPSLQDGQ